MSVAVSAPQIETLRDVDLGADGITGSYVQFIGQLGRALGDAIVIAFAWFYLRSLPPGTDYHLTATISATMLVKLALLLWALKTLWTLANALRHGGRWLGLEARGMQWAEVGGEKLRVIFYRGSDHILRCDETTRTRLAAEDQDGRRYRNTALLRDGALLAVLAACYFYLPSGLAWMRQYLGADLRADFDRWDIAPLVPLVLLLFVIVPRGIDLLMVLLESVIHAARAQFMPGAKLPDV